MTEPTEDTFAASRRAAAAEFTGGELQEAYAPKDGQPSLFDAEGEDRPVFDSSSMAAE
jgi:hypothetical protein